MSLWWPEYLKAKQKTICAGNTGVKCGTRGMRCLSEEVWWRRGKAQLQGHPAMGPIHSKSSAKSLTYRISLSKSHFPHLTTKLSGCPFLYGGPGHNPTVHGDFSLPSKAEIHYFYYVWEISTPSPNLQFSSFKNRTPVLSINKQICQFVLKLQLVI